MFDYISLIFIVILVLGALIGFLKGGFKSLFRLGVLVLAIVLSIFLAKPLANALQGTGMATNINNSIFEFIADKISFEVGAFGTLTGKTEVTTTYIDTINAAGQLIDSNFDLFHKAYESVHLPSFLYETADSFIKAQLANYGPLEEFAFAAPIAGIATSAICSLIAYFIIFFGTILIGTILTAIVSHAFKSPDGHKPLLSRITGLILGLVLASAIIWVAGLTLNIVLVMDNSASEYIRQVIHLDDESWTFAKWIVTTDFGYQAILSNFIK